MDHEREVKLFGHERLALPNRPVTLARNSWNVKEKEEKEGRDCPQARKQKAAMTIKWPGHKVSSRRTTAKEQKARDQSHFNEMK